MIIAPTVHQMVLPVIAVRELMMVCCIEYVHMCKDFVVNSLDKFTYQASADRPWISTIKGPAARLESLRTVKSSAPPRSQKSYSKRRSHSDVSDEDSFDSSSESESSFSDSESDASRRGRKSASRGKVSRASPTLRASERIRESKPVRKYREDSYSSSDYSSESGRSGVGSGSRRRKAAASPKITKSSKSSPSSSENASSDYDSEEFYRSDYSSDGDEALLPNESDVEEPGKFPIIDKILAKRRSESNPEQWEYLVKWRHRSYLHCEWLPSSEMMRDTEGDKRSLKMKNFNTKHPFGPRNPTVPSFENKFFFNPMFEHVEKIISVRQATADDLPPQYLVKWQGIPYGESTWEYESDLKPSQLKHALDHFKALNDEDRCETRMKFNSRDFRRKPGGDATIDFSKCLEAVAGTNNGPTEYLYRPISGKSDHENHRPFTIFDFQKEGISWLLYNWNQGRGSMLADEMGLGKTVQTSVTLAEMKRYAEVENLGQVAFLIIAPLSTIEQWKREIRKWTNLEPVIFHGNKRDRGVIRKYEFEEIDTETGEIIYRKSDQYMPKFDVLITTFEMVSEVNELFQSGNNFVWTCVVIDEAHKLKSNEGKARLAVMSIATRHRILLTGTPIQNDIKELWNLLHLCSPSAWPDQEEFLTEFGNLKSAEMTQKLQAKIQPFLLQRKKADVLAHLVPAKEETIISVELTKLQKETYRAVYEKNLTILTGGGDKKNAPTLTNVHMELRKCCNHPFLVQGVEDRINQQLKNDYDKLMSQLILSSGKMVFLDKLLEKLRREKSKILIFSQFTMMLDLIEDYLRWKGYMFERLDGAVKTQQRQEAIDRFNKTPSPEEEQEEQNYLGSFVFLLSTKAGGVGLNLTAANYVLLFDHDWNPQNDLQAQARCHRIGQTREVQIFRLITRGTYEEKMFQVASQKLGLEQAVMSGAGGDSKNGPKLSKEDMDRLLKEGAYAMLEDSDENEKKFCSENVEEILRNRSKTVSTFVSSGIGGGGFSKARFQVNTEEDQSDNIDVNDPQFWAKMAAAGSLSAGGATADRSGTDEILDYSQRKGRAQFGASTKKSSSFSDDEAMSLDSDFSEYEKTGKSSGSIMTTTTKKSAEEIAEEMRTKRMKIIYKFLFNFGPIWNKEIFDEMFLAKFGNTLNIANIAIPAYMDMLALIIGIYVLARDTSSVATASSKFDDIHFSPSVRFALGIYNKIASSGLMETPPHSAEALNVDGMVPDFLIAIDRTEINVPGSLGTKVPKYIVEGIPLLRSYRRLLADLDAFNEMKFLISNPHLMKKLPNLTPSWTSQDDVELLRMVLERGRDDLQSAATAKWGASGDDGASIPSGSWAWSRVEKLLPKFSTPRSVQLTLLFASHGYPERLFDRAIRASGYQPWIRKFSCGDSCLELLKKDRENESVEQEIERLKLLTQIDQSVLEQSASSSEEAALYEQNFYKNLLSQLPQDTVFSASDLLDYAKALLYRVVIALGKKSDKHDAQLQSVLKVSKQNENFFSSSSSSSCLLWPLRELTRIEAFKLLWRFQTLHFIRMPNWATRQSSPLPASSAEESLAVPNPIPTVFIPIAKKFGLDDWDIVTRSNRHLTSSELLRSVMKYVCQFLIDQDKEELNAIVVGGAKKRQDPPESQGSAAPAPKRTTAGGTITALFSSIATASDPQQSSNETTS